MMNLNRFFPFLVLCLGMALAFTAVPRVRAALNHVPVETGIDKIAQHHSLTEAEVSALIRKTQKSIELFDHPDYWQDLSELFYFQAQNQNVFSDAGQTLLRQSADSAQQSLLRSPANAFLWYKLASIDILLNEPPDKTRKKLRMSIITGPHDTAFLIPRLRLCLSLLPSFTSDDMALLADQVVAAWDISHKRFVKAIDSTLYMDAISALLINRHPLILQEMVTEFEKTH